jgi:hypothetical protein
MEGTSGSLRFLSYSNMTNQDVYIWPVEAFSERFQKVFEVKMKEH